MYIYRNKMGNIFNPVAAVQQTVDKSLDKVSENVNVAIEGVNYNISKAIDAMGETVMTVTKQVGNSATTIFKDTERNAFMFLGNTAQNITNAYIDTEQNVVFGIRSPIEKSIHVIDNQLDQVQVLAYDTLLNLFSTMQMSAIIIFLVILLGFIFLAKKEYILKIIEIVERLAKKFL
jgi:translation elongation factor EF-G